jgi:hypothetical protein
MPVMCCASDSRPRRVEADFREVVQLAVNELLGAGVGLDPNWPGDHVVVGQLLLLHGVHASYLDTRWAGLRASPAAFTACRRGGSGGGRTTDRTA